MKMPKEIIERFENAAIGLDYGNVILTLSIKQGKARYILAREESFLPEESDPSKQTIPILENKDVGKM